MPESPFEVLGLPRRFEIDLAVLEGRVRDLQRALHPDRLTGKAPAERRAGLSRAVLVNEAYRTLRDDLTRAAALLSEAGEAPPARPADPSFLMEIMDLRESLAEARAAGSAAAVTLLATDVATRLARARGALATALDVVRDTAAATDALTRMRYYRRFLDEVEIAEEDARERDSS